MSENYFHHPKISILCFIATSRPVRMWVQKGLATSAFVGYSWQQEGERNLTHLQLLFNITTPVVDIWSERKSRLWIFLVMCLNRKKTKKPKHYRYEMSKRQQGFLKNMATGLHAQRDGVDRRVSPLRYHEGIGFFFFFASQFPSVARAMFIALSEQKKKKSQIHAAVWVYITQ